MRQRGFTLIEVLVAFTILGLILGAALGIVATGLGAIARDADYGRALIIARSRLDELEASEDPAAASGVEGERFAWEVQVEPYEPDEGPASRPPPGVRPLLARVTVRWPDAGTERELGLTTLVLAGR